MGAPMPRELRAMFGQDQHPARRVACPRCGAEAGMPCHTRARERRMPQPHPARVSAWATGAAACPACGAPAGSPCEANGWPLHDHDVHQQRHEAAERAA